MRAKKGKLKSECRALGRRKVAGVIPPFGLIGRMRKVVAWELVAIAGERQFAAAAGEKKRCEEKHTCGARCAMKERHSHFQIKGDAEMGAMVHNIAIWREINRC